jgi:preprotein translocase SecE subunit
MGSALTSLFAQLAMADNRFFFGMVSTTSALSLLSGAVVFAVLIRNQKAMTFTDEVIDQLAKVTWPNREDTVRASGTVVVSALFIAGLLSAYDFVWKNVADYFLFAGS